MSTNPTRRNFLMSTAIGLNPVLLNAAPHHAAKAKRCIFLLMEGGPSHIDTFDPKPRLNTLHMTKFQKDRTRFAAAMNTGERYYVRSPFEFKRAGQLGIEMNTLFESFSTVTDDICFYRGLKAESVNHPTALYHLNTGTQFGGDPAIGSWVCYGLGSQNPNLPGFVVLPDVAYPQGGAAKWARGYLPAHLQGTPLRSQGAPILDMAPPKGVSPDRQKANLDYLSSLNKIHQSQHPGHEDLAARIQSYELAFRMQKEMPQVLELDKEPAHIREMYGIGGKDKDADSFGKRCLLARRLIEAGTRFVQVIAMGWDSHDYIDKAHGARIRAIDKGIAGLIKDLKQRGLLEDTLVVWSGEFGRSPDNGIRRNSTAWGRDHNANAMSVWLAGGGVKRGAIIGATDETGLQAVEQVHPLKDFHVTLLHLLGLDDNKLRFTHAGREKQLSQVGGELIRPLLA